jgi:hypothetical protein
MGRGILLGYLCIGLVGCYTPITEVNGRPIRELIQEEFTDDAAKALESVEIVDGPAIKGYAAGTTFLSNLASFITGCGWGRKVILDTDDFQGPDSIGPWGGIKHELIHHLDDMGRDGEQSFIDLKEFEEGFASCYGDQYYHGIVLYVENRANHRLLDLVSLGELSEHIAYCGELIARQGCPKKLGYAYRRILRKYDNQNNQ